jgi:hypothetical protein
VPSPGDPFYLDELAYDPLAFTSAADARSLAEFPGARHDI